MKDLKIYVYKASEDAKPETIITIPFSALHTAVQLLPKKTKSILDKEGIDLNKCKDLVKEKDLKGTIIEIENPSERMVIAVD